MSATISRSSVREELRRFAPEPAAGSAPLAALIRTDPPAVPYRGINTFRFVDAPVFFARDADVYRLVQSVTVYRGTLLYGESGVGKSSLINAGFLPAALVVGFRPERVRVQPRRGEEIVIERISVNSDEKGPFLPSSIVHDEQGYRATLSIDEFGKRVRAIGPEQRALFIFDQFEEIVTLFEDAPNEGAAALEALALQSAVLDLLAELLRDHSVPIKLLFSFREDYLARLTKLFERVPDLADRYVRLTAPNCDDLDTIVGGPLRRFPDAYGNRFPEALLSTIVNGFRERFRGGAIVLTEVQIACWKLWTSEGDPTVMLARPGGIQELLESYVTDELQKFSDADRVVVGALLARLVTRSGARNIMSRDDLLQLVAAECGLPIERVDALLTALDGSRTRLVRSELRQNVAYYTIVSEFLVPWIRQLKEQRLREEGERKLATERAAMETRLAEEHRQAEARLATEREAAQRRFAELEARRARQRMYLAFAAVVILAGGLFVLWRQYEKLGISNKQLDASEKQSSNLAQALRDTNVMYMKLKDSANLVARLRADSLVKMDEERRKNIARADTAVAMAGSSRNQLLAALNEKAQLQLEVDRGRNTIQALQRSLGSTSGANEVVRRSADSSAAYYQTQLSAERALRLRAAAELDTLRTEQARISSWLARTRRSSDSTMARSASQLCSLVPKTCRLASVQTKK